MPMDPDMEDRNRDLRAEYRDNDDGLRLHEALGGYVDERDWEGE